MARQGRGKRRKSLSIVVLGDAQDFAKGAVRQSKTQTVSRRTGRRRTKKFGAEFIVEQPWVVTIDSRDLSKKVGDRVLQHLRASMAQGKNPESGRDRRAYDDPETGPRIRGVKTGAMLKSMRRTFLGRRNRYTNQKRTRNMRFYFASKAGAGRNKQDSTKRGKRRVEYLGIGGRAEDFLERELGEWMDGVVDGRTFEPDTLAAARGD